MMDAIAAKDTAAALQLFSQLYSQGKDASAMLGELSTLARDMLVIKTAPQAGLGMISSTCTAKEATQLAAKFSPAELLRIIDLVQETANGFKSSQNQRLDGERIELTHREYELLKVLMQNKNIVMDREKLLNLVCGYDYAGETNIIDVYIRYIRAKIDDRFGIKLITTVRSVGYVIKEGE